MKKRPPVRGGPTTAQRSPRGQRTRDAVATVDAEDIALARLQAQLRKSETVHSPSGPRKLSRSRTTLSLSAELLRDLRLRARREGLRPSQIVEAALAQYLKLR